MKYLGWGVFYEGRSDAPYLDVIIPRIIRDVIATGDGDSIIEVPDQPSVRLGLTSREVTNVAKEACEFFEAFEIVFVHSDTGGRGLQATLACRSTAYCEAMHAECDLEAFRCICLTPRHETEAWILADGSAVLGSVGIEGDPQAYGLPASPQEAERLVDPKRVLNDALDAMNVRPRSRNLDLLFPTIANRQRLSELYRAQSIRNFRDGVRAALIGADFLD